MDISLFTTSANKSPLATQIQKDGVEAETGNEVSDQAEQFDTFLELLTAQIRNQDPLAPLDSTQFVEQLATFSNLELQAKNNQILESIAFMLSQQLGSGGTPASDPAESDPV